MTTTCFSCIIILYVVHLKIDNPASFRYSNFLFRGFIMENQENVSGRDSNTNSDPIKESAKITPQEAAMIRAKTDRKVFVDALQKGNLSCLPGKDGFADTTPVSNITNGTFYHGINMLLLKEHQKINNYPTAEYLTFESVQKANEKLNLSFNEHIKINKGEKAFTISYKDSETNEPKSIKIFNIAQLSDPQKLRDYVAIINHEKQENLKAYLEKQGKEYKPYSKSTKDVILECTSTKAEEYLGQYFAAVSSGAKFKVTPEQASEFSKNINEQIFARNPDKPSADHPEGTINPFNLSIIGSSANKYCKELLKAKGEERKAEYEKRKEEKAPKKENSQSDSVGMGM